MSHGATPEAVLPQIPAGLPSATGEKVASRLGDVSWALYERSRSPYLSLVTIYVFAPCFANTVIGDSVRGQGMWSFANTLAGFASPLIVLGLGLLIITRVREERAADISLKPRFSLERDSP